MLNNAKLLFTHSFKHWWKHRPYLLAGSLAFYMAFSLGPILVLTIGAVGFFFGRQAVEGQLISQIRTIVGNEVAVLIQDFIKRAYNPPSKTITTIISVPMLVGGAAMLFFQIRTALNTMWDIKEEGGSGFSTILKSYGVAYLLLFIISILLLLLSVLRPLSGLLELNMNEHVAVSPFLFSLLDYGLTVILGAVLISMIYQILPQADIKFKDVLLGGAMTSIMVVIAQIIIGWYVKATDLGSAYGAFGAISILFLLLLYSGLVFLLGAAFTKVYAENFGSLSGKKQKK
ncbi:MAG: YihY/virulence factor BrkB family protein [Calditrichia bacterium]